MKKVFGEGLRLLRLSKKVSQEKLAQLTDYKQSNLSMIENGTKPASKDLIMRIAEQLETPYEPLYALKVIDSLTESEAVALYEELKKMFS